MKLAQTISIHICTYIFFVKTKPLIGLNNIFTAESLIRISLAEVKGTMGNQQKKREKNSGRTYRAINLPSCPRPSAEGAE